MATTATTASMVPTNPTLWDRQIASIKRILNLNAPITASDALDDGHVSSTEPTAPTASATTTTTDGAAWKVLVFDDMGRDVISSVLRVHDLRASGVRAPVAVVAAAAG